MRLAIASDHGGYKLKAQLVALFAERGDITLEDLGTNGDASVDYPDYAHKVATGILAKTWDLGILVCGTGVGMSIAANRHAGIRCVVCSDTYTARLSRSHNDSNILSLGERVVGPGLAWDIVTAWLAEPVDPNQRHATRRAKIELPSRAHEDVGPAK